MLFRSVFEGIPPLHRRESRIIGAQSETYLIHMEALGHVVSNKPEWFIRAAKFNRELQRLGDKMTMVEVLFDSE